MINMLNGSAQTDLLLAAAQTWSIRSAMVRKQSAKNSGSDPAGVPARRVPMRDFSRSLPMSLLRAREAVMRQFRPSLRHHGLTEQQWRILRALAAVETIEVTELARTAFLLGPSLSRILRDLEARQLIERRVAEADQRRAVVSISAEWPQADRGGRAVVGSDLCRHYQALRRPQARRAAGHAACAGTQPFRNGSGGGSQRGGGPVSANLHDATGSTHSGRANHRNHRADGGGSHRHARDFSLKVAAKLVMKTGAGAGVAADDAAGPY